MCNTYVLSFNEYADIMHRRWPELSDAEIVEHWERLPDYHKDDTGKPPTPFELEPGQVTFNRWTIRKTDHAPILRVTDGALEVVNARWGFDRTDNKRIGHNAVNNTRDDQLWRPTSMWQEAWEERRCLIPATAFYEWRKIFAPGADPEKDKPKDKIAHAIALPEGPMMIAGIWEDSKEHGPCYSMLTTENNTAMGFVHNRMPAILPEESWDAYLVDRQAARKMIVPFTGELQIFASVNPLMKAWKPGPPSPAESAPVEKSMKKAAGRKTIKSTGQRGLF